MLREVRTVVTSWKGVRRVVNLQEKEENKLFEMMDMFCIYSGWSLHMNTYKKIHRAVYLKLCILEVSKLYLNKAY